MATYARPGTYVQETLNPIAPIAGASSTTVGAFVGASDRGPTTPTLITSWSQYTSLYGGWNTIANNNLPIAVYLYFANGGSGTYVLRVPGSGATAGTRSFSDNAGSPQPTLKLSASSVGSWGGSLNVTISNSNTGVLNAVVTAASATGGVVTYTANNTFTAGQIVSITGLSTSAFNLTNVTIATATSTQFTVSNAATGTAVTGASASAITQSNYFNISVYLGGTTSAYLVEQWPNLIMKSTDPRYAVNVINQSSKYIVATDLGSTSVSPISNPSTQTNIALTSYSDGSVVTGSTIVAAAFGSPSPFDTIQNSLLINVAGFTDASTINSAISYASGRTDSFVVIDATSYTGAAGTSALSDGVTIDPASQLILSESYTSSSYAAVYYPQITISDPTAGVGAPSTSTKTVGAAGAVMGIYAATDASRGVFKAPAGLGSRVAGAVSVPSLSSANLDALNSDAAPVNAIRYIPGAGIVVFGSRTLQPGFVTQYVPVRRTLIYLEKSLTDLTRFAIFEPNDSRLWARINATVSNFLTSFWSQGGLAGSQASNAFFVKCDSDNNTQSAIDNGYVNIQVGVALQRPAEFVVINIGQFDGGTTITQG